MKENKILFNIMNKISKNCYYNFNNNEMRLLNLFLKKIKKGDDPSFILLGSFDYLNQKNLLVNLRNEVRYKKRSETIDFLKKRITVCYGEKPIVEQLEQVRMDLEKTRDLLGLTRIQDPLNKKEIFSLEEKNKYLKDYISLLDSIEKKEEDSFFIFYYETKNSQKNKTFLEKDNFLINLEKGKNFHDLIEEIEKFILNLKLFNKIMEGLKTDNFQLKVINDGPKLKISVHEISLYISIEKSEIRFLDEHRNPIFYFSKEIGEISFLGIINILKSKIRNYLIEKRLDSIEKPDWEYYTLLNLFPYSSKEEFRLLENEIEEKFISKKKTQEALAYKESVYLLILKAKNLGLEIKESRRILRKFKHGKYTLSMFIDLLENGAISPKSIPEIVNNTKKVCSGDYLYGEEDFYKCLWLDDNLVINYRFAPGVRDFIFSLEDKGIFNMRNDKDRCFLHQKYGGKKTYLSWSGYTGNGYLPKRVDLFKINSGFYSGNDFFILSKNYNSSFEDDFPIMLFKKNKTIYFIKTAETLTDFLNGKIPEENLKEWEYPYLYGNFKIKWWSEDNYDDIKSIVLPFNFKFLIRKIFHNEISSLKGYWRPSRYNNPIFEELNLRKLNENSGIIYGKLFNLPIRKVNIQEVFQGKFPSELQGGTKDSTEAK